MQAHAAFCRRLMDDFCGEITGRNVDCLVGVHPQDRFLVGMLSPYEEAFETSTNSSSVIVSQIGIDFFLEESDIRTATLQILPAGDLFYRVVPKLEHQRQAFLKEPELVGHSFENIAEFAVEDVQRGKGIKPIAVYQKTKLSEIVAKPLRIALNDFYNYDSHSGVMPEDHQVNILLSSLLYEKTKQLADTEDAYFSNHERVHLRDVLSEEAWQEYIQMNRSGKNPFLQNWYLAISIEMQKIHDGRVRVSVKLCNKSKYQENDRAGSRAKRETERVNDLFNAKLSIDIEGAFPLRFPMPYFKDDYKYDTDQYAIGSGCSVLLSDDHLHMETSLLPVYEQYRLKTRPGSEVAFTDLINKPVVTLKHIYDRMLQTHDKWEADYSQKKASGELTEKGQQQFRAEIDAFGEIEEENSRQALTSVFELLHTISHQLIRQAAALSGLDKSSLSEYIFCNIPAIFIYCQSSQGSNLGAMFSAMEAQLSTWIETAMTEVDQCIFDPVCKNEKGACAGCLFLNDISCRYMNKHLDRRLLIGYTDSQGRHLSGFWEE